MSWKRYLLVSCLSLILLTIFAFFQLSPGYMDAEYYYGMGLRIANDRTLSEPFIWNYLNDPVKIPHPGFSFWMPLPAFLSSLGVLIGGQNSFLGAKTVFILVAASVPALTMKLGWEYSRDEKTAFLAGLLAAFPFLYAPVLGTTDSFGIMMILGAVFSILFIKKDLRGRYVLFGIISGIIHLSRADGFVWLGLSTIVVFMDAEERKTFKLARILLGYLLVMTPWFVRNWMVTGELMPSSSSYMFWLTEYNELFNLNAASITFQRWFGQGWRTIIQNIFGALKLNIGTLLVVQWEIILVPLIIYGYLRKKNKSLNLVMLIGLGFVFVIMTVLFPFAGSRGGFFHSGAGFQPVIWVLAADGLLGFLELGSKKRGWKITKSWNLFSATLILIMIGLSGFALFNRVIGHEFTDPAWNKSYLVSQDIDNELSQISGEKNYLAMLNNPPGYYVATGKSAVAIPNGPVSDLMTAADRFGAQYIVLDRNYPESLADLYTNPGYSETLTFLYSKDGIHYFKIIE